MMNREQTGKRHPDFLICIPLGEDYFFIYICIYIYIYSILFLFLLDYFLLPCRCPSILHDYFLIGSLSALLWSSLVLCLFYFYFIFGFFLSREDCKLRPRKPFLNCIVLVSTRLGVQL
ncbi:hypothetical protein BDV28DRAFT_99432 [Aspergillus coremiiformis]|uniref:Uncharacterized protein n=1 Tax=Aspergillus coremiiformis TaxID=138285 RepID=A0A5N6YV68_9EURO|nr:hypothetical protein BDV28DRAFT_99432 [Aspergillus coremiiformis]